ncbi:MAG: MATE family efflux transporter [Alcanivoracaceae bacterium]|nr:MATE family efflux transporter [Alcanivoracaceae bacterium]
MAGSRDLTRGPVRGHLVHLGAPMVVGIVAVLSISLVDAWFVGKLGLEPLAALSFTFPVVFSIASVAIGLGAGAASVVSRAIGTGDRHRVQRLATDSLLLSVLVVAALSTLGWFTIEPLFRAMGARDQVLGYIVDYMQIWYLGMPFLVVPMVANSLIRADGDSRIPSLMMVFAAIANIGLNPVFIFGLGPIPAMGIQGAAVATVIARALSMMLALFLVFRHRLVVTGWPGWAELSDSWRHIAQVGLPAGAANVITPFGVGVLTAAMARLGPETVAAFGVATRVETLAAIPMLALSGAIGPVVGQNWGKGEKGRVREALLDCFRFCLVWALVMAVFFWLFAGLVVTWFTDEAAVQSVMITYLQVVPLSLAGYGVIICASAAFNGLGKALVGMGFYLLRTGIFYVPLGVLASFFLPPVGVFAALALANVLAGLVVSRRALVRLDAAPRRSAAQ